MGLRAKLQVRDGRTVTVEHAPPGLDLSALADGTARGGVLVFVRNAAELAASDVGSTSEIVRCGIADDLVWIAYPKGGALGTDLDRDRLAELVAERGLQPVRQVALDDTWSAMRFRPPARG